MRGQVHGLMRDQVDGRMRGQVDGRIRGQGRERVRNRGPATGSGTRLPSHGLFRGGLPGQLARTADHPERLRHGTVRGRIGREGVRATGLPRREVRAGPLAPGKEPASAPSRVGRAQDRGRGWPRRIVHRGTETGLVRGPLDVQEREAKAGPIAGPDTSGPARTAIQKEGPSLDRSGPPERPVRGGHPGPGGSNLHDPNLRLFGVGRDVARDQGRDQDGQANRQTGLVSANPIGSRRAYDGEPKHSPGGRDRRPSRCREKHGSGPDRRAFRLAEPGIRGHVSRVWTESHSERQRFR